jgi:hypothetical protein
MLYVFYRRLLFEGVANSQPSQRTGQSWNRVVCSDLQRKARGSSATSELPMHFEGHVSIASSQLPTEDVTLPLARWLVVTTAHVAVLSSMAIIQAKTRALRVFAIWNPIAIKAGGGIAQLLQGSIPCRVRDFSLLNVQTGSGAHPISYKAGTGGCVFGGKTAGA